MPVAAFTQARGASSVCRIHTQAAELFVLERTESLSRKGYLIKPYNSHEFSQTSMPLSTGTNPESSFDCTYNLQRDVSSVSLVVQTFA